MACIGDDRPWLIHSAVVQRVDFEQIEMQTASSGAVTAYGLGHPTAAFDVQAFVHVKIVPMDNPNWTGFSEGVFNVADATYGAEIDGDVQSLLLASPNSGGLFGPAASNGYGWHLHDTNWDASVYFTGASIVNYELNCLPVTAVSGSTTSTSGNVLACSGASGDDVMGYGIETSGASNQMHTLITHGLISPNSTNSHLIPITTSNFYPYGPQMACTASGGGIQAGMGRSCPNGGVPVGTLLRSGPAFFEINTGTSF